MRTVSIETPGNTDDSLQALERFVVESDELLELEERIGRFNIFDALGVVRAEIRHSNFLAWLLDSNESHGQGALFLRAILMDLLKEAPPELRPLSPVELDGEEMRGVEVRREWKNIDLLITCKEPPFVIAIENKIDSGESSGQLNRYKTIVHEHFSELNPMFVFLTTDGSEPSDDDWVPYSYADIHRVLDRVRRTGEGAIGDDVEAFLEHYLRLIGSRFMDDPKIDELCQRIYKNHRQALDLIFERMSATGGLLSQIAEVIEVDPRWRILRRTNKVLRFVPSDWDEFLPPIGSRSTLPPTQWLFFLIRFHRRTCSFAFVVAPTRDATLRLKIIERLTHDPDEFGLKIFFKSPNQVGKRQAHLSREKIATWKETDGLDHEKCIAAVKRRLDHYSELAIGIPDALRPIIEEWQSKQDQSA